jgi:membrane-associated phospholipid phosphatase
VILAIAFAARPSCADDLRWSERWQRVEAPHIVATGVTLGATIGALFLPQTEEGWTRGILFDDWLRERLALGRRDDRDTAIAVGDAFYWGMMLYPVVADIGVATLAIHQSTDVAWQMFWIDGQAFALAGLLSRLTQKLVGRDRPYVRECARDPSYDLGCDDPTDRSQGFVSGHTAMAFTGAALICTHHAHLRLYRNAAADALACSLGVAGASWVAHSRMVGDRHYASDVIAGGIIGVAAGWLLPELLHYRFNAAGAMTSRLAVMPLVGGDTAGLLVVGELDRM